jgi:hypothetical protein
MTPRSRQLLISLIVACAMFMQNLDCQSITPDPQAIGRGQAAAGEGDAITDAKP